jgi:Ca-activated chloride channel homolog
MAEFHFIRPWWLLAILLLITAFYLLKKLRVSQSGWEQILPKHLSQVLISSNSAIKDKHSEKSLKTNKPLSLVTPMVIGLLAVIALAGPTWQKQPQPVFQINQGSVLIMDMSYSMYATDINPNRLTRARYKAIDLLNSLTEGDVGLIAYAGDAFIISPLTEDVNNIKLLLPSLSPDLMPELGSNPLAALTMADEMLKNAGHLKGDIYWLTDGVDREDISDINQFSKEHPHRLHILGVGTPNGAPIKLPDGKLLKDNSGAIVIPRLNQGFLSGLAKQGRGSYQTISNDNHDIDSLLASNLLKKQDLKNNDKQQQKANDRLGDQWQEAGPYLLLLVLPLLLGYFRRGNIVMLLPLTLILLPAKQADAGLWQDLWQTNDQQAQQKYNQKAYKEAAEQFNQPLWQGSAYYKAGDYQQALEAFQQSDSAQALYNQGNALAKLNKLEQAIAAYNQALAKNPTLEDAKKNKKLIEDLKKQQDQQQKQDQQGQNQNQNQNQNKDKSSDQQKQDQQKQNQQGKDQQSKDQSKQQQKSQQDKQQQQDNSSEQQKAQQKQAEKDAAKKEQEQKKAEQAKAQQKEDDANKSPEQKAQQAQAKLAKEQLDKEKQQKYQQLMNKVTDDPYLLLRNKMQLEYQKRRGNHSNRSGDKQW